LQPLLHAVAAPAACGVISPDLDVPAAVVVDVVVGECATAELEDEHSRAPAAVDAVGSYRWVAIVVDAHGGLSYIGSTI